METDVLNLRVPKDEYQTLKQAATACDVSANALGAIMVRAAIVAIKDYDGPIIPMKLELPQKANARRLVESPACHKCAFGIRNRFDGANLECHKNSPRAIVAGNEKSGFHQGKTDVFWPTVSEEDFCGEFTLRTDAVIESRFQLNEKTVDYTTLAKKKR